VGPRVARQGRQPKVTEGGPGYVAAYNGIQLLDVPTSFSRTQGDIHVFGNPHIWTAPLNGVQIARNILTGLKRVSPENADYFTAREKDFEDRIYRALYGDELVRLLSGPTLADLDLQGTLFAFLQNKSYQGSTLFSRLGGWLKQGMVFRGREIACYTRNGITSRASSACPASDYIEPKPGIPPTPRHVQEIIAAMRERHVRVLLSPAYFDHNQIEQVAERTGAKAVIVPSNAAVRRA